MISARNMIPAPMFLANQHLRITKWDFYVEEVIYKNGGWYYRGHMHENQQYLDTVVVSEKVLFEDWKAE